MKVHLIAIAGGSGSGKTWLAKKMKHRLGRQAGMLSLDDFYRDLSALAPRDRERVNVDHPDAIDWDLFLQCLRQIRRGETTLLPHYDFTTHTRRSKPRVWQPRPVVLIDGLWLLLRPELRRIYSLMVYADCPEELRLSRRMARDRQDRGRSRASVLRQWRTHVKPMHDEHVAPQVNLAKIIVTPGQADDSLARLVKIVEQWSIASERG